MAMEDELHDADSHATAVAEALEKEAADLAAGEVWLEEEQRPGNTALHLAVQSIVCSATVISTLIRRGADPNVRNKYGHTPLHCAAANWAQGTAIGELIAHGADTEAPMIWNKYRPLHVAIAKHNIEAVKALLEADANQEVVVSNRGGSYVFSDPMLSCIFDRLRSGPNRSKVTALQLAQQLANEDRYLSDEERERYREIMRLLEDDIRKRRSAMETIMCIDTPMPGVLPSEILQMVYRACRGQSIEEEGLPISERKRKR